jgi:sulfate adenylyltransferase (ADP) / ATP adenylyltransferase
MLLCHKIFLKDNSLWNQIVETTEKAKNSGALLSIPTEYEIIESEGIPFLVRIISNLVRKEQAKKPEETKKINRGENFNPFLPYEQDLFVTEISDTHIGLLNKYNVVDHHLLLVTRDFEEQESLLNLFDFIAIGACFSEMDGLAFYNSGTIAGASVRHKHLQFIPLPLIPNQINIPIESIFDSAIFDGLIGYIPQLPFKHGLVKFELDWNSNLSNNAINSGRFLQHQYHQLLHRFELLFNVNSLKPYNLLVTKNWMLMIPRSQEFYQSISINALGFAGALLVKNQEQLAILKQEKPLNILANVGFKN